MSDILTENEICDISDADNMSTRVTKNEKSREYEDKVCKIAFGAKHKLSLQIML